MKTILVACGTGIATSTVAAKKCEGICKEAGIQVKLLKLLQKLKLSNQT